MTDLERARAHLLERQKVLYEYRCKEGRWFLQSYENAVLAALSWVWEEQEKQRIGAEARHREWLVGLLCKLPAPSVRDIDWNRMWQ